MLTAVEDPASLEDAVAALDVKGNFMFDPATQRLSGGHTGHRCRKRQSGGESSIIQGSSLKQLTCREHTLNARPCVCNYAERGKQ